MKVELAVAYEHVLNGRTISGRVVEGILEEWEQIFSFAFLSCLETHGIQSASDFANALESVIEFEYIGQWLIDPALQAKESAAFGFVVFDRLAALKAQNGEVDELLMLAGRVFECLEYAMLPHYRSQGAARAASAKGAQVRCFVQDEWLMHRQQYNLNKSEFARVYVRRVWNEYKYRVTDRQIKEVWLSDTRLARKVDGLPAER